MSKHDDLEASARQTNKRRILLLAGSIAVIAAGVWLLPFQSWLAASAGWVDTHPVSGGLLYVGAFVVFTVAMMPGSILILCGGYLFGMHIGMPLSWLGVALGAGASSGLSRTLARDWLARRFADDRRFIAIDSAVARRGFTIVMLTRLSLIMPFNVLNVIYGLSRIPLSRMTLATAIGMTPAVALYTYLGTVASNINQLFSGKLDRGWAEEAIVIFGLLMVALVTYIIHRTATRALKRELRQT